MNIQLNRLQCKRCSHAWIPRGSEVRVCAKCHSPYWDRAKSGFKQENPIQAKLEEMVRRIVKVSDPEKIILFGSHATGRAGPGSDVDLMILTNKGKSRREEAAKLYEVLGDVGVAKDIVVIRPDEFERFKDIPGSIIYPAAHDGQIIYERAA